MLLPIYNRRGEIVAHAQIDDCDAALVDERWFMGPKGYAVRYARKAGPLKRYHTIFLHREVLTTTALVDHKNRDRLDCRRENLRAADHAINAQNRAASGNRDSSSCFRGVSWDRGSGKWRAYARINGRLRSLGRFDSEQAAGAAASQYRAAHMPGAIEPRSTEAL